MRGTHEHGVWGGALGGMGIGLGIRMGMGIRLHPLSPTHMQRGLPATSQRYALYLSMRSVHDRGAG
jgi:hypothetical protein